MGDFFELLVAMAIIAVGVLGGRKKKKPPQHTSSSKAPASPPRGAPRQAPKISAEDIGRILGIEIPKTKPAPPPRAETPAETARDAGLRRADERSTVSTWEEGVRRRATTTETLVPAGGKSHERFHDLYLDRSSVPAVVAQIQPDMDEVRRAIIWKEILDLPVGLR